jgi:hypothetical protein
MENTSKPQVYWIDCIQTTLYFEVSDDGTVRGLQGDVRIPADKFHDFLATAQLLGIKTGKL